MKSGRSLFSKKSVCLPLVNAGGDHVRKYRIFRTFLSHNLSALRAIAELEQTYYSGRPVLQCSLRGSAEELLEAAFGAVHSFEALSGKAHPRLIELLHEIHEGLSAELNPVFRYATRDLVIPFARITPDLKSMVGAKAEHLSRIRNTIGLPAPDGFCITAYAFERFMEENRLWKPVERELGRMSPDRTDELERRSRAIREMIMNAPVPVDLGDAIRAACQDIEERAGKQVRLAVRSSAVGEDTDATFAGQYTTVLNSTVDAFPDAYRTVIASKYSGRAVSYRRMYGLDDRETPMCVAAVVMVDAKSSGVLYTADAASGDAGTVRIHSLWGLGEHLVDGSAPSDLFLVHKKDRRVLSREVRRKDSRLVCSGAGSTASEEVPQTEREMPSLTDAEISRLVDYSMILESSFKGPQDIEWAVDRNGEAVILQCRPLAVTNASPEEGDPPEVFGSHDLIVSSGLCASGGIAAGAAFILPENGSIDEVPQNAILVARTASPRYARLAGIVSGIVTDIGSPASHLASVAREFGIPAIFDTGTATSLIPHGETITISAAAARVYRGRVEALADEARPARRLIIDTPAHRRLGALVGKISPLNLLDPEAPSFSPEGCRTVHDIIRFTHEYAVRSMFGLTDAADGARSIHLSAKVPITLHLIDLGGGLRSGLSTCDTVTPEHIESAPLRALWRGFTHPGISWEGTINFNVKNIMTLFASGAVSEFGEQPGGVSYAILAADYMNLSAKFGYHFATVDSLCGETSTQNYIALQFAGGAGNYYGKSLRISFLSSVLGRLGFQVAPKGDLLEAHLSGHDRESQEKILDLVGRLLASSRLLDMAISGPADCERLADAFFRGEYDHLSGQRQDQLQNFYTHGGLWKLHQEDGSVYGMQDGSRAGFDISSGIARIAGKIMGPQLQEFLDTMEAYYYFPLAVAKESETADGTVSVRVQPRKGHIDRAGGLVFGLRNAANYFVFRINALEDNAILFEYVNDRRIERASVREEIRSNRWYQLAVRIQGSRISCLLDDRLVIEYEASAPVEGSIGIWTKADSVTLFDTLTIEAGGGLRTILFSAAPEE